MGVVFGFSMRHLAEILSMRELTTVAGEYSMEPAGGASSPVWARDRMPSAKPSSTALFASIQVSLSMRWDSLARDKPLLIS